MFLISAVYVLLFTELVRAFRVGWSPVERHRIELFTRTRTNLDDNVFGCWPNWPHVTSSWQARAPTALHIFQTEYQTFFNDASRSGEAFINKLSPEERARRAIEASAT